MEESFERYVKNTTAFSQAEVLELQGKNICVVGCGGLGGHVIQTLARFGIKNLTLVDGDVFCASNLNRQVFATEQNLGRGKAEATKEALALINSEVTVKVYSEMLTEENAQRILKGHDLIMDCLDSSSARLILDDFCNLLEITYIHGAIAGFYGQISCVFPGDSVLRLLYEKVDEDTSPASTMGNPPFTPQAIAAMQCSEALKVLTGRGELLRNKILFVDLFQNSYDIVAFSEE